MTAQSWIFVHQKYQEWLSHPQGMLWLKGNPGTGKSTLMALIKHDIEVHRRGQSECISHFFDRNGHSLQKSKLGMFRSLLHQMYRKSVHGRDMILKVFQEKRRIAGEPVKDWDWQLAELEALFSDVVVVASQQTEVIILIDALDEAFGDESGIRRTAQHLVGYLNMLKEKAEKSNGYVKICISCRNYPGINTSDALELVAEEENEDSIRTFVTDALRMYVEDWTCEPERVRSALIEMIVQKANRQFLWVNIRVPMVIAGLNDGTHSFDSIHRVLEAESSTLYDLYESVLTVNVSKRSRSVSSAILRWIVFAERPLSLAELRCALQCEDLGLADNDLEYGHDLKGDQRVEKLTKSSSGGLAYVSRHGTTESWTTIRFVHQTVYEYIQTRGLKWLQTPNAEQEDVPSTITLGSCEYQLSRACLKYWISQTMIEAIQQWEHGDETIYPFMEYAITNWAVHAAKAEKCGISNAESLLEVFDKRDECLMAFSVMIGKLRDRRVFKPGGYLNLTVGENLLHVASAFGLISVVEHLLLQGESVDRAFGSTTPLHYAAERGHAKLVRKLLDAGADPTLKSNTGETALELAVIGCHTEVVMILLKYGAWASGTPTYSSMMQRAANTGNVDLLYTLIDSGADVNLVGGDGETALATAVRLRHFPMVRFLIDHGGWINPNDIAAAAPLQIICRSLIDERDEEIFRLLLSNGADVNTKPGQYGSALTAAVSGSGHIGIIRLLLAKGASVNTQGGESNSAIQAAAERGNIDIVRLLLEAGADPDLRGGFHGSALHAAAANRHGEQVLRLLISRHANIRINSPQWGSILQAAVFSGTQAVVEFLIGLELDVNEIGGVYGNALHSAICGENGESMVRLILDHGADPNSVGAMFGSPLEAAISKGRVGIFHLLIERGAKVDSYGTPWGTRCLFHNEDYPTYLQIAVLKAQRDLIVALLEMGEDINAQGTKRGNVLSAAVLTGKLEIVQLLFEQGVYYDDAMLEYCLGVAKGRKQMTKLLQERRTHAEP